ncbi:MAG: T9SS type A sorting domain-containing protein [Bacteroidetes bacterium]|nr:T9SS type A sorting domain-containing protein [Bacteroidota bacterium]
MKKYYLIFSAIVFRIFLVIVSSGIFLNAQDIYNPYKNYANPSLLIQDHPPLPLSPQLVGYAGEYMISIDKLHWYQGFPNLAKSYKVETVSFPFMMPCWQTGCADGSTTTRILRMPQNINTLDGLTKTFKGNFTQGMGLLPNIFSEENDIVSVSFRSDPLNPPLLDRPYYAHTILKFTIYLHCGNNTNDPIIDSLSWVYDNTRGRMRYYPFRNSNTAGGSNTSEYDVIFRPLVLADVNNHSFSQNNNASIYNPIFVLTGEGTINYFPFETISKAGCASTTIPANSNIFYNGSAYNFYQAAPYTLMSGMLMSVRGQVFAGHEESNLTNFEVNPLFTGIKHTYKIDKPINLTTINSREKIIYNPSEVEIDIGNINTPLVFPSNYIFKTIQGRYPTTSEVQAAAVNKVYDDIRNVPVSTSSTLDDDPTTSIDDRISYYYIFPGSKLRIDPCVTIFDAEIKLIGPGAILEYDPANTYGNFTINNSAGGTVTQVSSPQPLPCAEECHNASFYDYIGGPFGAQTNWTTANITTIFPSSTGGVVQVGVPLTIPSGTTITMNAGLRFEFGEGGKIVIEPGGSLIVNGTSANPVVFTSACQKMWKGIDVQGIKTSNQSSIIQGKIICNNAMIENALTGISTSKKDAYENKDLNSTGGIIRCQNTTFRNCRVAVEFLPYSFTSISYFINCIFETTGPFIEPSIKPFAFASLNNVTGVPFLGCTFANTFPTAFLSTERGKGIVSIDSYFMVNALSSSQLCKFQNLSYGIDASNAATLRPVFINKALFGDNTTGNTKDILLSSNPFALITSNQFNTGFINDPAPYGLYLNNCRGYKVEDNDFFSTNVQNAIGTIVNNGSPLNNEIYRNRYYNVKKGLQHQGIMLNTPFSIKCNDFTLNPVSNVDIAITSGLIGNQGSCSSNTTTPAGNTFLNICKVYNPFKNIWVNTGAGGFSYSHHTDAFTIPTCRTAQISLTQCTNAYIASNSCPSTLSPPCNPACERQIISEINTLTALLVAGDAPALYQIIASNSSAGQIKNALLAPGPYLSDGVLIAAITRTNPLPPGHIKDIIIPNSPVTSSVMTALNSINLPNGIRKNINDAQTGTSARAQVEAQLAALPPKDLAVSDLFRQYLNDSTIANPVDSVISFLVTQNDLTSRQTLLQAYLTKNDCQNSRTTFNQISSSSSSSFVTFYDLMTTLCEQSKTILELTADERFLLENLALQNADVSVSAQNILRFVYGMSFPEIIEDLIVPDSLKIKGVFIDGIVCGGNPVIGDTLFMFDSAMQEVSSITPVVTDANGNFAFDFFEVSRLNESAQFSFGTKSGLPLQTPGFQTITDWIAQSPITLVRSCPVTTYQKTIGGTGNEENNYCIHTPDGGFLIAGSTTSAGAGGRDIYVMRTDSAMNILWSRTFGGPNDDVLFDRQPTLSLGQIATPIGAIQGPSGGFIILGHTFSFGQGSSDLYLLRIGDSGNLIWSKTFGTNQIERGISVQQLSNGDLLLLGDVESGPFGGKDVYIIRTDVNGNTLWNKRLGAGGADQIFGAQVTSDGGFIFAGATTSSGAGNFDAHLLKSDASGNIQWSKTYGGFSNDSYQSIVELSSGGYAVTGYTQSFGAGTHDFILSNIDANGNILWSKTYGGGNSDIGDHLIQTSDGGYAFMGPSMSFGAGNFDVMLTKTDNTGNLQWSEVYGGAGIEIARSLDEMNSGGYHICGFTNSFGAGGFDIYSIRTDANGLSGCNEASANPTVTSPTLASSNFTPNMNVGGIEGIPATQTDGISFITTTLCPSNARTQNPPTEPEKLNLKSATEISIYPNPNSGEMTIKYFIPENENAELTIFDLMGRKKASYLLGGENNQLNISEKDLPEGVYFYTIISNGIKIKQDKIIVIK